FCVTLVFYHSHPDVSIGTPDDKKLRKPPINAGQALNSNIINQTLTLLTDSNEHYKQKVTLFIFTSE
ncbi:MAG: hypothetical protein K9J21_11220, partial [Bacteroidales bacterium]|nr:hypothetical protein [Bacteroidales bacterium]